MKSVTTLINRIKNKDRKIRCKALDDIMMLSRSQKRKQKTELLKILNHKSFSPECEERYVSMYGVSRYMWRGGKFEDLKQTYSNVIRLLEDNDGRVRVAAFNALEHFRTFFTTFAFGADIKFDKKEIIKLWTDSLFLLWEKIKSMEKGHRQRFLMKCVDRLFRPDMEEYLNKKEYRKYSEIWNKLQEIEEVYNESRGETCY